MIPGIADSTCPLDGVGDTVLFTIQGITATGDGDILTMEVTGADTAMDTGMEVTTVEDTTIRAIITEDTTATTEGGMHILMVTEIQGMAIVNQLLTGRPRRPLRLETITGRAVPPQQTVVI